MILYQDCSSHIDSSKNMAARGQGLFSPYIYIENFKNLLVRNHWSDFNIILQKCSFGDPLPRLFKPYGFVKKTWPPWLIFPIYLYRKLKIQAIWICQKTWPPGGGAYFPYISIQKTLKIFLSETTGPISI